jgi:hypothetical protein
LHSLTFQAPPSKPQKTIENTRELDETIVQSDDEEVHMVFLAIFHGKPDGYSLVLIWQGRRRRSNG